MTLHLECYVVVSSWNTGMAVSRNAGCLCDLASTCRRGRLERACEPFRNNVDLGRACVPSASSAHAAESAASRA